jgi:hypothetical protein
MRFVIGLFKVNTQATQYLSAASRVENVSAAVQATKSYTENLGTTFWKDLSATRAVFLAPEYCFARSLPKLQGNHTFGSKRQMEEDYVKDKLRPVFSALSKNFQNALIVPGTVAWRKSIMPADGGKHGTPQDAAAYRLAKYGQRIQNSADVNMFYGDNTSHNFPFTQATTVFPDVPSFRMAGDNRLSVPTIADKATWLQTAHYIAKNTAHCYYNGDCVYKYDKIGDFYEVSEATTDTVMVPNRGSNVSGATVGAGRFRLAGFDYGISVCYDQSLSMQNTGSVNVLAPLQKTAGAVDCHLLLSAHIPPHVASANLTPGGYLLSCSSDDACNKVMHASGAVLTPTKSLTVNNMAGLDLYVIE